MENPAIEENFHLPMSTEAFSELQELNSIMQLALHMGFKDIFNGNILHDTIPSNQTSTALPVDLEVEVLKEDQNFHMATLHGSAKYKEYIEKKEDSSARK